MKKGAGFLILFFLPFLLFAQNEIGPEGDKLIWFFLLLCLLLVVLVWRITKLKIGNFKKPLFGKSKIEIYLKKEKIYFPNFLTLTIKNSGNKDVDLDRPVLIFDNFFYKRKFKLKGVNNIQVYPLYLEAGKTHSLKIDLNHFYSHDKLLKRHQKIKVVIYDMKGKLKGSKSTFIKKTLVKW